MRTSAEANGEGQIDNQTLLELSDDWSDGHFGLGGWVGGWEVGVVLLGLSGMPVL